MIRPYLTERVLVLERIEGRKVDAGHGLAAERAEELARRFFRANVYQVTVEGVYTPIHTAATSCSPPTAASRSSISAYPAGSTTTRTAISRCFCLQSPRTEQTTRSS